jgi:hypothetical protein
MILPETTSLLREYHQIKDRNWKINSKDWKDRKVQIPSEPNMKSVVNSFRNELKIPCSVNEFDLERDAKTALCTNEEFNNYVGGGWLEYLVLQVLIEKQDDLGLNDMRMNLKPVSSERSIEAKQETKFEIDVIALRGYQLFAFSCGTSPGNATLKRKLFEAYFRANQLGGDEARVALVTLHDNPEEVEDEAQGLMEMSVLSQKNRDNEKRYKRPVRVFGRKHLKDLSDQLTAWIEYQSGEKR